LAVEKEKNILETQEKAKKVLDAIGISEQLIPFK